MPAAVRSSGPSAEPPARSFISACSIAMRRAATACVEAPLELAPGRRFCRPSTAIRLMLPSSSAPRPAKSTRRESSPRDAISSTSTTAPAPSVPGSRTAGRTAGRAAPTSAPASDSSIALSAFSWGASASALASALALALALASASFGRDRLGGGAASTAARTRSASAASAASGCKLSCCR